MLLLKDTNSLSQRSMLGRNIKNTGTKLTNFCVRAGEAWVWVTLSRAGSTSRSHYSIVELSTHQASPAQVDMKSELSINLANNINSTLVVP